MLRNGLFLVADEAALRCGDPLVLRYRSALVLGSLREDVLYVPALGVTEYPSFRHFGGRGLPGGFLPLLWPGPRMAADGLYRRALVRARGGDRASVFVSLGRIVHILTDACIPSHVHRVAHDFDPFEWYVEGRAAALRRISAARLEPLGGPLARRPSELVASLAAASARHRPDRTNTPVGRWLRRVGVRRPVKAREARAQAEALVPDAIAGAKALLDMFLGVVRRWPSRMAKSHEETEREVLRELMDALEMPPHGLEKWFAQNRAFCEEHGGRRVYGELLALLDRCDEALAERCSRGRTKP